MSTLRFFTPSEESGGEINDSSSSHGSDSKKQSKSVNKAAHHQQQQHQQQQQTESGTVVHDLEPQGHDIIRNSNNNNNLHTKTKPFSQKHLSSSPTKFPATLYNSSFTTNNQEYSMNGTLSECIPEEVYTLDQDPQMEPFSSNYTPKPHQSYYPNDTYDPKTSSYHTNDAYDPKTSQPYHTYHDAFDNNNDNDSSSDSEHDVFASYHDHHHNAAPHPFVSSPTSPPPFTHNISSQTPSSQQQSLDSQQQSIPPFNDTSSQLSRPLTTQYTDSDEELYAQNAYRSFQLDARDGIDPRYSKRNTNTNMSGTLNVRSLKPSTPTKIGKNYTNNNEENFAKNNIGKNHTNNNRENFAKNNNLSNNNDNRSNYSMNSYTNKDYHDRNGYDTKIQLDARDGIDLRYSRKNLREQKSDQKNDQESFALRSSINEDYSLNDTRLTNNSQEICLTHYDDSDEGDYAIPILEASQGIDLRYVKHKEKPIIRPLPAKKISSSHIIDKKPSSLRPPPFKSPYDSANNNTNSNRTDVLNGDIKNDSKLTPIESNSNVEHDSFHVPIASPVALDYYNNTDDENDYTMPHPCATAGLDMGFFQRPPTTTSELGTFIDGDGEIYSLPPANATIGLDSRLFKRREKEQAAKKKATNTMRMVPMKKKKHSRGGSDSDNSHSGSSTITDTSSYSCTTSTDSDDSTGSYFSRMTRAARRKSNSKATKETTQIATKHINNTSRQSNHVNTPSRDYYDDESNSFLDRDDLSITSMTAQSTTALHHRNSSGYPMNIATTPGQNHIKLVNPNAHTHHSVPHSANKNNENNPIFGKKFIEKATLPKFVEKTTLTKPSDIKLQPVPSYFDRLQINPMNETRIRHYHNYANGGVNNQSCPNASFAIDLPIGLNDPRSLFLKQSLFGFPSVIPPIQSVMDDISALIDGKNVNIPFKGQIRYQTEQYLTSKPPPSQYPHHNVDAKVHSLYHQTFNNPATTNLDFRCLYRHPDVVFSRIMNGASVFSKLQSQANVLKATFLSASVLLNDKLTSIFPPMDSAGDDPCSALLKTLNRTFLSQAANFDKLQNSLDEQILLPLKNYLPLFNYYKQRVMIEWDDLSIKLTEITKISATIEQLSLVAHEKWAELDIILAQTEALLVEMYLLLESNTLDQNEKQQLLDIVPSRFTINHPHSPLWLSDNSRSNFSDPASITNTQSSSLTSSLSSRNLSFSQILRTESSSAELAHSIAFTAQSRPDVQVPLSRFFTSGQLHTCLQLHCNDSKEPSDTFNNRTCIDAIKRIGIVDQSIETIDDNYTLYVQVSSSGNVKCSFVQPERDENTPTSPQPTSPGMSVKRKTFRHVPRKNGYETKTLFNAWKETQNELNACLEQLSVVTRQIDYYQISRAEKLHEVYGQLMPTFMAMCESLERDRLQTFHTLSNRLTNIINTYHINAQLPLECQMTDIVKDMNDKGYQTLKNNEHATLFTDQVKHFNVEDAISNFCCSILYEKAPSSTLRHVVLPCFSQDIDVLLSKDENNTVSSKIAILRSYLRNTFTNVFFDPVVEDERKMNEFNSPAPIVVYPKTSLFYPSLPMLPRIYKVDQHYSESEFLIQEWNRATKKQNTKSDLTILPSIAAEMSSIYGDMANYTPFVAPQNSYVVELSDAPFKCFQNLNNTTLFASNPGVAPATATTFYTLPQSALEYRANYDGMVKSKSELASSLIPLPASGDCLSGGIITAPTIVKPPMRAPSRSQLFSENIVHHSESSGASSSRSQFHEITCLTATPKPAKPIFETQNLLDKRHYTFVELISFPGHYTPTVSNHMTTHRLLNQTQQQTTNTGRAVPMLMGSPAPTISTTHPITHHNINNTHNNFPLTRPSSPSMQSPLFSTGSLLLPTLNPNHSQNTSPSSSTSSTNMLAPTPLPNNVNNNIVCTNLGSNPYAITASSPSRGYVPNHLLTPTSLEDSAVAIAHCLTYPQAFKAFGLFLNGRVAAENMLFWTQARQLRTTNWDLQSNMVINNETIPSLIPRELLSESDNKTINDIGLRYKVDPALQFPRSSPHRRNISTFNFSFSTPKTPSLALERVPTTSSNSVQSRGSSSRRNSNSLRDSEQSSNIGIDYQNTTPSLSLTLLGSIMNKGNKNKNDNGGNDLRVSTHKASDFLQNPQYPLIHNYVSNASALLPSIDDKINGAILHSLPPIGPALKKKDKKSNNLTQKNGAVTPYQLLTRPLVLPVYNQPEYLLSPELFIEKILKIHNDFLTEGSPHEINLSGPMVQPLRKLLFTQEKEFTLWKRLRKQILDKWSAEHPDVDPTLPFQYPLLTGIFGHVCNPNISLLTTDASLTGYYANVFHYLFTQDGNTNAPAQLINEMMNQTPRKGLSHTPQAMSLPLQTASIPYTPLSQAHSLMSQYEPNHDTSGLFYQQDYTNPVPNNPGHSLSLLIQPNLPPLPIIPPLKIYIHRNILMETETEILTLLSRDQLPPFKTDSSGLKSLHELRHQLNLINSMEGSNAPYWNVEKEPKFSEVKQQCR